MWYTVLLLVCYVGLLLFGWGLVGIGVWFLSRQMQRYNPPIPALVLLIGLIFAANILSLGKVTFVHGEIAIHPFLGSSDAWERGWPFRWYGIRSIAALGWPDLLLYDTIWWTISMGAWSYLTIRCLPFLQNRYQSRLFVIGSIAIALMSAYYLPYFIPSFGDSQHDLRQSFPKTMG
jgi:hypothetical protein